MDFYFNIVTVINFLTSVINAIVLTVCYRKRIEILSGIVTVAMETLAHPKETQALQLSDDVFTTDEPVTLVNNGTTILKCILCLNDSYCIIINVNNILIVLDICITNPTIDA